MNVEEIDVYRELQEHMDQMPIGFPATRSGIELRILKRLFTPEEAKIATKLRYSAEITEPLESIYERVKEIGISIGELEKILDNMVKKGTLLYKKEGDKKYYANALFVVGMAEFQLKTFDKEFLTDFFAYAMEGFVSEIFKTKIPQLRTIPIEQSITLKDEVASYDDLKTIIENMDGPFAVQECICRKVADMLGRPCKVTEEREICIGFGPIAQMYIDQGWGRQLSKEETLEILRKNEEDGLVLQPSNSLRPDFICSCCSCCCDLLIMKNIFPRPVEFFATNYYAEVDREMCIGCGECFDRCQMKALTLDDEEKSKVDLDRCIGCGLCVIKCPQGAIVLRKKEEEIAPPKDNEELYTRILNKKLEIVKAEVERKEKKRKRREERKAEQNK